jgi:hypothetical protein
MSDARPDDVQVAFEAWYRKQDFSARTCGAAFDAGYQLAAILAAGVAAGAARPPTQEPPFDTNRLKEWAEVIRIASNQRQRQLFDLADELDVAAAFYERYGGAASRPRPQEEHMTHGLERTSPKGGPFLGQCRYCGQADLPMSAALDRCESAPSQDQQVIDAIEGAASPPPQEPALRITDKLCSCGTPLVWITAQQGAVCVVCLKDADDCCVCDRDAPPPQEPDKLFILLAEIRQCINDDKLMAAQRKVMAIEELVRAGRSRPPADPSEAK